ncbi:MAG: TetR/AcrR family transcriptional regulator [Geminicoccaceae bacterium]
MTERPAHKRRRSNDPEAMRRRVLDVAARAFQARGYHATSTHDIMREAGVTGGALHHHFPTKKALGLAVIRERVAQAVEETWIEPVGSARTAADGIGDVFGRIAATLDDRGRVLGCPLNNLALELALADSEFQSAVQNVFEAWQAAITQRLRADQAAGALKNADPEGLATLIVASYSGAMAMAKANQSSEPLKRCAQQLATLMRSR